MPRRKTDQQHQEALAHEAHRGHPNYPHEEAGTCTFCAHLSLELVLPEREAIDTGQLTRAQRTALLLYPGDSAADRAARAAIVAAPQDGPDAPPLGKITNAAALAYLQDAGLDWVLTPTPTKAGKTTGNLTTNPVCVDAMRLVAAATDEALKVPDSPAAQGWRFWVGLLQDVQKHLGEHSTELLITKPRKALPPILEGARLLEHVSSSQAAQMVAEIDATEFSGDTEPYPEYADLEQALLGHLTAIYEGGWYAVSALLAEGELRVVEREGKSPMLIVA